jgi:hypothetical protein
LSEKYAGENIPGFTNPVCRFLKALRRAWSP